MSEASKTRGARRSRSARAVIVCFSLVAGLLVVTASPARAKAAPWRWAKVTQVLTIQGQTNSSANLPCPAGYVPVSGGQSGNTNTIRMLEYPNPAGNSFTFTVRNTSVDPVNVPLVAWCAHSADTGTITSVLAEFVEVSNQAGGVASCPAGQGVLSGGADWATTGDRSIQYMGPTTLGDGFFAVGSSAAINDTLGIEVRCVANENLVGQQTVVSSATGGGPLTATCPAGKRVMTGGSWTKAIGSNAHDTVSRGRSTISTQTPTTWTSTSTNSGGTFTAIALCIPVSKPTLQITGLPAHGGFITTSSGQFSFTATDPAGEPLTITCSVSGSFVPCQNSQVSWGPLADGIHRFQVHLVNTSEQITTDIRDIRVDVTPPEAEEKYAANFAELNHTFVADFNEAVTNVDSTTFRVYKGNSTTPMDGVVSPEFGGDWRFVPAQRLVPGETYTVELSAGIEDVAGHNLSETSWEVLANPTVQNTSVALIELWDLDKNEKASDGKYISSRTTGSKISLKVNEATPQDVSIWGMRSPSGGYGAVYVDNVLQGEANFYAPTLRRKQVFTIPSLSSGAHVIEVRVLGTKPPDSKAPWVHVDSIDVGTTTLQQSELGQHFRRDDAEGASGGSYDTIGHGTKGDNGGKPVFKSTFVGNSIRLTATKSPKSGSARVFVDGVRKDTINLRADATKFDRTVFERSLSNGTHEIKVVPVGTRSGAKSDVSIDRLIAGG